MISEIPIKGNIKSTIFVDEVAIIVLVVSLKSEITALPRGACEPSVGEGTVAGTLHVAT